jgi:hypothetical protein
MDFKIPEGWKQVEDGYVVLGDKAFNPYIRKFVSNNSYVGWSVKSFYCVIRYTPKTEEIL